MRFVRGLCCTCALLLALSGVARAEGFALNEWSARGVSLAGGLVGRADDVSALAYNAAGITQLPGTQLMAGLAFIAPMGTIDADLLGGRKHDTTTKPATFLAPHGFVSHQLNDDFWLGLGIFSRFGVGNSYAQDWVGRYNVYDVGLQTISFVPTVAWKINDIFSVSAGVEVLYAGFYMGNKIPTMQLTAAGPSQGSDNDLQLQGDGWGVGAQFGLHMRFNEQWSVGLAYKSQVTLNIDGEVEFGRQGEPNLLATMGRVPEARNCGANATVQLPDSLALGVAYRPLDELSFEVGAVWTRWSTYNALNIYMDSGYASLNDKAARDGLNLNASVEYWPLDWWALRAGVSYETPVLNEKHADFLMPTYGRTTLGLGTGVKWNELTLDFAYAHLWIHSMDYGQTDASGLLAGPGSPSRITDAHSKNVVANIYMFSVGYSF
ncbi:MAG: transporter [Desulfovibrio sp.]|uniref:OmpP1/FadL family transporter n=1 Tax=Desulfovibrio sp. TaxID=885 RepID=UPI001A69BB05|nr:outer membrane protein transport protein [Desulfovibrio sp.]MBD5417561.1 transporter [Desulfovibrio sp.]